MSQRLFIGVPVLTNQALEAATKRLRIGAQKRDIEMNWVPAANFHITLCFLGATPEEQVPVLSELLNALSTRHAPLTTSLRGVGGFPDERHARVLWVGVRKSRSLALLQNETRESLVSAGFTQEERDYQPHLTIGRTRKARSITDLISPYVRTAFGDIDVNTLTLFESVVHGGRAVYIPKHEFKLTGSVQEIFEPTVSGSDLE